RNSISNPATGLQIFNTDCGINEYYTGTCWIAMNKSLKAPDHITCSGTTDVCTGATRTFSVSAVTGATNYEWSVPAGSTITSGQGTISINVTFGTHSGEVCVTAVNACETSSNRCMDVFVNSSPATPGNISGNVNVCANSLNNVYSIAAASG